MRLLRLLLLFLVIVLALNVTGCTKAKTWSATFNSSYAEISDWRILTTSTEVAIPEWSMDNSGLYMHGKNFSCPFGFTGDFTMNVVFDLFTDPSNTVDYVAFAITDGVAPLIDSARIQNNISNLGNPAADNYFAVDMGSGGSSVIATGATLTVVAMGENEYRLVKEGSNITVYLNDVLLWASPYSYCDADPFVPMFAVEQYNYKRLLFRSITVEYEGDIIAMDYDL